MFEAIKTGAQLFIVLLTTSCLIALLLGVIFGITELIEDIKFKRINKEK